MLFTDLDILSFHCDTFFKKMMPISSNYPGGYDNRSAAKRTSQRHSVARQSKMFKYFLIIPRSSNIVMPKNYKFYKYKGKKFYFVCRLYFISIDLYLKGNLEDLKNTQGPQF